MRRLLAILTLALTSAVPAGAQTLSTRDVVELSKAGLGEEVLLALIEVNRSVFPVDRETLKSLKDAGVPANVIVAMVRSGREQVEPPPPPQPMIEVPQETQPEGSTARERELELELERARDRERELERSRSGWYSSQYAVAVPVYVPVPVQRHPQVRPQVPRQEPVYWGWDGKRRPDSWDPAPVKDRRDPTDASVPRTLTVPKAPGGGR